MAILFNDTTTSLYLHEDPHNHFTQKLCKCFGMQSALMITRRHKTGGILSWPSISLPNAFSRPERELWKPFLSVGPKFTQSKQKTTFSQSNFLATGLEALTRPQSGYRSTDSSSQVQPTRRCRVFICQSTKIQQCQKTTTNDCNPSTQEEVQREF